VGLALDSIAKGHRSTHTADNNSSNCSTGKPDVDANLTGVAGAVEGVAGAKVTRSAGAAETTNTVVCKGKGETVVSMCVTKEPCDAAGNNRPRKPRGKAGKS
jgi:hypothetical protein